MSAARATCIVLGLLLGGCSPTSRRSQVPPHPNPLPALVKGATLRAVGDARRGYGTRTARQTMQRLKEMGVNTICILLNGRMTSPAEVDVLTPNRNELAAAHRALDDARTLGFATILIPHLYVDDGTWRGYLNYEDEQAERWWQTYNAFIETSAEIAEATGASALSIGVELKAMSKQPETRNRIKTLVTRVRAIYRGAVTYSANWDEAESVLFWDEVDFPSINGYYPLQPSPERGAETVARRLRRLAEKTKREVLVLEVGYRSSPMSHVFPWEWPEQLEPRVDETAQAEAWAAVLAHWLGSPGIRGLVIWVIPSDPDDPASEPMHGFNPLNKAAEAVIARGFRGPSSPQEQASFEEKAP